MADRASGTYGPVKTRTPAQRDVETSRQRDYSGPSYGEPYEYESDMVRSSMREQGKRKQAARTKDPVARRFLQREAKEAHSDMQFAAQGGLAAREQARQRKRAKKRD